MIKDCFPAYLVMAIWTALILAMLLGCAADPEPPITAYRRAYGFTP